MPTDTSPESTGSTGSIPEIPWETPYETVTYYDELVEITPEMWDKMVTRLKVPRIAVP